MDYLRKPRRFLRHLPVLPFIYPAIVPIVLLDIWVELYHRVSFPLYGLPCVKRRDYIRIDRHKLAYLHFIQKINCVYCGYANGLLQYWVRIFGETEKYWCGIRHRDLEGFKAPPHHSSFLEYGDEASYRSEFAERKTRMF